MATLEENVLRIQTAKANIKTAIESKGVVVADDAKLDEYSNYVNSIQHGGGVDTSDATVTDSDIVMGKIGYGKDGKVYGSRKYVEDATVYFSDGKLCTSEPVYLDPNNPVTMYSFDVFTDPTYIAEGYKAYVGGGLVTGMMQKLDVGFLIIQQGGILDIPYIGYFEYASMDMKTIPGIGDLAPENIAYGKTICGITGTHGGAIPGNQNNYVLPDYFTENIKIVFWLNYNPVLEVPCSFISGSGTSRRWESQSGSEQDCILVYESGQWRIKVSDDSPVMSYNSKLQKHGWSTPGGVDASVDYVTIEDKDWTSGPIFDVET